MKEVRRFAADAAVRDRVSARGSRPEWRLLDASLPASPPPGPAVYICWNTRISR